MCSGTFIVRPAFLLLPAFAALSGFGCTTHQRVESVRTEISDLVMVSPKSSFSAVDGARDFVALPMGRLAVVPSIRRGIHYTINLTDIVTGEVNFLDVGEKRYPINLAVYGDYSTLLVGTDAVREPRTDGVSSIREPRTDGVSSIQAWDVRTRSLQREVRLADGLRASVLLAHDANRVYARNDQWEEGAIHRIDLQTGKIEDLFGPHSHVREPMPWGVTTIELLSINPKGDEIVIGAWQQAIAWDVRKGAERASFRLKSQCQCRHATVSRDGTRIAIADGDSVVLFDFQTGKRIAQLGRGKELHTIGAVAFSPNCKFLVVGVSLHTSYPSNIFVWRLADLSRPLAFRCHDDNITAISFFPDNGDLVTGSVDGTVRSWELDKLPWFNKNHE